MKHVLRRRLLPAAVVVLTALSSAAFAAPPAPYSLPWQLRPAAAANVARSDTSLAFFSPLSGGQGFTAASMLLVSTKVTPNFAPLVRVGYVSNSLTGIDTGSSLVNPVVGGTYALPIGDSMRLAFFLGLTVPVGQGGGNTPDALTAAATRAGIPARSAMDNAMFAVNDFTVFPGIDFAYVANGLTVQLEATVLQLTRVRGEAVQQDASRTNFTSGLHVGYFVAPFVSFAAELRYQRWLSTPVAVANAPELRDNATFAVGPRFHIPLNDRLTLRPGLSYATALDAPMQPQRYSIVQVDLPLYF